MHTLSNFFGWERNHKEYARWLGILAGIILTVYFAKKPAAILANGKIAPDNILRQGKSGHSFPNARFSHTTTTNKIYFIISII